MISEICREGGLWKFDLEIELVYKGLDYVRIENKLDMDISFEREV